MLKRNIWKLLSILMCLIVASVFSVMPVTVDGIVKDSNLTKQDIKDNQSTIRTLKSIGLSTAQAQQETEDMYNEVIKYMNSHSSYKTIKSSGGKYPERAGAILVTPDNVNSSAASFKLGHAGIVLNKKSTVEAGKNGVRRNTDKWTNRRGSNKKKIRILGGTVLGTSKKQDSMVASWCKSKIGCRYNYDFYKTSTRGKFYCSQLVWAGFKDKYKINLNTPHYDKGKAKVTIAVAPLELLSVYNIKKHKVKITYSKNYSPS